MRKYSNKTIILFIIGITSFTFFAIGIEYKRSIFTWFYLFFSIYFIINSVALYIIDLTKRDIIEYFENMDDSELKEFKGYTDHEEW